MAIYVIFSFFIFENVKINLSAFIGHKSRLFTSTFGIKMLFSRRAQRYDPIG